MSSTTVAPAKAPSAAATKPSKAITAARRLTTEKQAVVKELARLNEQIQPLEREYDRLAQSVKQGEADRAQNRYSDRATFEHELEAQQAQLKKTGETLAPLYNAIKEQKEKLRELEAQMPSLAQETLRTLHPLAVQTQTGLQRLDEIEARLTTEREKLQRESDPEGDLTALESVSLKLSVIPGKRDFENDKLAAQLQEMKPFFEAAKLELSRRVSAREEFLRGLFLAAVQPFFAEGKLPPRGEYEFSNLFLHTQAVEQLRGIENSSRSGYIDGFALNAVPPLLAAFDALSQLEQSR
jgi:DNA repair exonuclease SbcCD ATPase subunit